MNPRRKAPRRARKPADPTKKAAGLLIGRARQTWAWNSVEKKQAQKMAETRRGWRRCAGCGFEVPEAESQVDHVAAIVVPGEPSPSIEVGKAVGWDKYLTRLWSELGNLQVLCLNCHKAKSKKENAERKRIKNAKKA